MTAQFHFLNYPCKLAATDSACVAGWHLSGSACLYVVYLRCVVLHTASLLWIAQLCISELLYLMSHTQSTVWSMCCIQIKLQEKFSNSDPVFSLSACAHNSNIWIQGDPSAMASLLAKHQVKSNRQLISLEWCLEDRPPLWLSMSNTLSIFQYRPACVIHSAGSCKWRIWWLHLTGTYRVFSFLLQSYVKTGILWTCWMYTHHLHLYDTTSLACFSSFLQ